MAQWLTFFLETLAELVFYTTGALALRILSFGRMKLDHSKLSISQSSFVAVFGFTIWLALVLMTLALFFQ